MTASPLPSGAVGRLAALRRTRIYTGGFVGAALLGLVLGATAGWRRWLPGPGLPAPPEA